MYTVALFLDLSKAFHFLDHQMILTKLEKCGIRSVALDWFRSYLNKGVKCTAASTSKVEYSEYKPVKYGTPQGSCLGLLLFLIFTNDLHKQLHHCSSILFADDATLYKLHRNLVYLQWCVQDDMDRLKKYFNMNKLTLNLDKTICVLFLKTRKLKN